MTAIAERAGWRLEFVETQWDAVFPALDAGRIDVVANLVADVRRPGAGDDSAHGAELRDRARAGAADGAVPRIPAGRRRATSSSRCTPSPGCTTG
ncbi:transporter substrate-binding domain-containing protein [Saccharopolyspora mangrovi]|uniref:transporter substrate-binding domain-containing protein n=1 Tax=Saccharopolyspora mangrovi TaxID=3082379 RepID=UPI00389A6E54